MKFETAQQTAERLGVTVRAVQKWAKDGKLKGAHKAGRDWLIPVTDSQANLQDNPSGNIFPLMCLEYTHNSAKESLSALDGDERRIALGEYLYFTGDLLGAIEILSPYLESSNPIYRLSAAVFLAFSNLCHERVNSVHGYAQHINKDFEFIYNSNFSKENIARGVLAANTLKIQLHLPVGDVPAIDGYLKYLSNGGRLIALYLAAYNSYLHGDYSRCLGIAETAINCYKSEYAIPMIYLNIMCAVSLMNLMQVDKAKQHIEKAWAFAEKDGFIMPFVEHYSILGGALDAVLKKSFPSDYGKIISAVKEYNVGWCEIYNQKSDSKMAANLTPIEFTVAMLYSRGWRAKEIAAHMELSERTIMNYIQVIYEKLHINGRKALKNFMLK